MDERLSAVRGELEASRLSSSSLVLVSQVVADAERCSDPVTLEQSLYLVRAIAERADGALRVEAERLVAACEPRHDGRPLWWDE